MKTKNIVLGLLLIMIGVLWMLGNLGFISWSIWEAVFRLWPLVLIVLGINIIFKEKKMIIVLSWSLFFIALIAYSIFLPSFFIR